MKIRLFFATSAAMLALACGDVHSKGQDITAPSAPAATGAPTQIRLVGGSRPDQQIDVTAQVLTADGKGVANIPVQFSITNGVVNPIVSTTDANGNARTIALTFAPSTITATIGTGLTGSGSFAIASALPLSVSASAPSVTLGNATAFSATVTNGTAPFTFAWIYGDGGSDPAGPANTISHTYASAGNYLATVKVTDASGRSGSGTISAFVTTPPVVVTPAPTPDPTVSATLACTPGTHGTTATVCNLTGAFNGATLPGTAFIHTDYDFGDGRTDNINNSPLVSHAYAQAGTYTITATLTQVGTIQGVKSGGTTSKSVVIP